MDPAQNTGFSPIPFSAHDVRGAEGPMPGAEPSRGFAGSLTRVGHSPADVAITSGATESALIEMAFGNLCRALTVETLYVMRMCSDLRILREMLCARGEPPEAAALRMFDTLNRLDPRDVLRAFKILIRLPLYDNTPLDLHAVEAKTYNWNWINQFPHSLWVPMREAVRGAIEGGIPNAVPHPGNHPGNHPGV